MSNMTCVYTKVILGETRLTSLSAGKSAEVGGGMRETQLLQSLDAAGLENDMET